MEKQEQDGIVEKGRMRCVALRCVASGAVQSVCSAVVQSKQSRAEQSSSSAVGSGQVKRVMRMTMESLSSDLCSAFVRWFERLLFQVQTEHWKRLTLRLRLRIRWRVRSSLW